VVAASAAERAPDASSAGEGSESPRIVPQSDRYGKHWTDAVAIEGRSGGDLGLQIARFTMSGFTKRSVRDAAGDGVASALR